MKKIPAIRGLMGDWVYYVAVLSFDDINKNVKKINDELHKSKSLSDAIQRSITDNYKGIKDYILNQDERFFNSLVLAVYDGKPDWIEVELELEGEEFFDLGFLTLNGEEKIFPVDGQHRVEGIKSALKENASLKKEKVPVIFIGHNKTTEGMQRTRRLFSTLNRYAKPVSIKDIIALDEDDIVAITTRYFVENYDLFQDDRVIFSLQKAIHESERTAFTSLITLSNCIEELLKYYFNNYFKKTSSYSLFLKNYYPEKKSIGIKDFRRFRPREENIQEFIDFCKSYWDSFKKIHQIQKYLNSDEEEPAKEFRNKENGGNILFRPIGILPFVQASMVEAKKTDLFNNSEFNFDIIIHKFIDINLDLNKTPWRHVAWDPNTLRMKTTGNRKLIKLLFLYLVNIDNTDEIGRENLKYIKDNYASFIGYEGNIDEMEISELIG